MRPSRFFLTALLVAVLGSSPGVAEPTPAEAFVEAKLLLTEGNYRQALELLESAIALEQEDPYLRIELARVLARINRLEEARDQAEEARRLAPTNTDVLSLLGQIYMALGDSDPTMLVAAAEVYEASLEQRPDDVQILHAFGRVKHRQGDLAGAEEAFRRILALQPGSQASAGILLQLLIQQQKRAEAIDLLLEQTAGDPENFEMRITLADLLAEEGRNAEAVTVLQGVVGDGATQPELLRRLATVLFHEGRNEEAIAVLDTVLVQGDDERLRLFRALLLAEQRHVERAVEELSALRRQRPEDPQVTLTLARMLIAQGKAEDAWSIIDELVAELGRQGKVEPQRQARLELIQLLAQAGEWERVAELGAQLLEEEGLLARTAVIALRAEALIQLQRESEALELLTTSDDGDVLTAKRAEALFRLEREMEAEEVLDTLRSTPEQRGRVVEVYHRVGKYDRSIPLLEEIRTSEPASSQVLFWLGAAYERTGQFPQAASAFQELLELAPDNSVALNYLGYMWAERGENLEAALDLVSRAVALEPNNPAYVDSLGWVYFQLGRYEEALGQLERAAGLLPGDATVLEHLGDAYRVLGHLDDAQTAYRRAADSGPEDDTRLELKMKELESQLREER